jgi:hypothetical protein
MWLTSRNLAPICIIVLLLFCAACIGACSQQFCVTYTYWYNSSGGYGIFKVNGGGGVTAVTSANSIWSPRSNGNLVSPYCVNCMVYYGCWVTEDCPSNLPCTAQPASGGCPNYVNTIGQSYCTTGP